MSELVKQQRSIVEIERMLVAIQAEHADNPAEVMSLAYDVKAVSDLAELKWLWHSRTLPRLVAQLSLALEVHETFGDGSVTIDDPVDAALWKSKYFVAVNDMTATLLPHRRKAAGG